MKTIMKTFILVFTSILLVSSISFGQGSGAIAPNWYPDDGKKVLIYRNPSTGNGTTTLGFPELIGKNFTYDGYFAYVLRDAAGTGILPQNEGREITDFDGTTGVITVGTAFTTALAAGDAVLLISSPVLQALYGTRGIPYVTGAEFDDSVSIAEGLMDMDDDLDTLRSELNSTTGIATFPTGVFHANGVSIAENAAWQSDTLRKIGVTTDSALAYIHSTTGMPAVTGVFPAAGVSLNEKVQFIADTLRKEAVNSDSILFYLHSTTGAPAVTGAFPAAGLSINERIQYLADSLRKVAVTTDTVYSYLLTATGAQWGTAAEPANGVNLLEGLGDIDDDVDSLYAYVATTTGAPLQTGAFPAAGVSLLESQQWQSDSLRRAFVQITDIDSSVNDAVAGVLVIQTEVDTEIDTLRNYFYGTTGAPDETGLFHAGGTSALERINWLQDSLRSEKVTVEAIRDSLEDANDILQNLTGAGLWSAWDTTIVHFTEPTWNAAAAVSQIVAITGQGVELEVMIYDSTLITTTSADTLMIEDQDGHVLGAWIPAAGTLSAGTWVSPLLDKPVNDVYGNSAHWRGNVLYGTFSGEINIDINDNDLTGGIWIICYRYKRAPFMGGGSAASGDGS